MKVKIYRQGLFVVALLSAAALVGCESTGDRVADNGREVDGRIDARTASSEEKMEGRVDEKINDADTRVDEAVDRTLDSIFGGR